ncbi:MAG: O-antigen ligase family protein [Chlorobi bacterium]|nr:O-antigen ligase family protein [Chlorobiota bacterium]MCI0716112.1 O-antigen ligase family protein [Chlorobiota bacterium]
MNKEKILKYIDLLLIVFLCVGFITSQYSIALSSIGIGVTLGLTVIRLFIDRKIYSLNNNLVYLFLLFIASQLVSSVFCSNPSESFINVFKKIVIYIIFFAGILFINESSQLKKIFISLFIFSALISTIEIVRFILDYNSLGDKPLAEFRLDYFGYPITNGEIKMLILLIAAPFIITKKDFIMNKALLILLTLPLLLSFYLTNARNALLGLFAGFIIIGLLKNKYFLFGLIAFIVLFLLFAPLPLKERMQSIADLNHPSNKTRIIMWETGLRMIKDSPVIGIGDTDINKAYRQYKTPEFHGEGSHMHNNLIQIVLTLGVFGGLAWLTLMIYIFIRQIKIYLKTKSDEFLNIITVSSLASMIAFQIAGLTEWNFGDAEFAAVLWFNLSLAFIAEKLYKKNL